MNWLYSVIEKWLKSKREAKFSRDKFFRVADEHADKGLLPVEILQGPFKGTVFVINSINILDDYGRAKFEHMIIQKQPGKHDTYYGNKFSEVVGDILLNVLSEAQGNYKSLRQEVLSDDEDGSDYIEEPVEERTVSSQGSTVPKK
jgi:hypothetical protein